MREKTKFALGFFGVVFLLFLTYSVSFQAFQHVTDAQARVVVLEERLTALETDHYDGMVAVMRIACYTDPLKWTWPAAKNEQAHETYLRLRRECAKIGGPDDEAQRRIDAVRGAPGNG